MGNVSGLGGEGLREGMVGVALCAMSWEREWSLSFLL